MYIYYKYICRPSRVTYKDACRGIAKGTDTMPFFISTQTAEHTSSNNQSCAEVELNEQAVADLFTQDTAKFSNDYIDLPDVVAKSIELDSEYVTEIICEIVTLKTDDFKKMQAVMALLKKHLSVIALGMNKEAA